MKPRIKRTLMFASMPLLLLLVIALVTMLPDEAQGIVRLLLICAAFGAFGYYLWDD